jgi:hypothetical protein
VEACDLVRGGGGWGEERLEKEFRDFVDLRDRERVDDDGRWRSDRQLRCR